MPAASVEMDRASEADLREARGAVALVASGVALDVVLCGLVSAARTASLIEAEARTAGVGLRLEPGPEGAMDLVVGPREG